VFYTVKNVSGVYCRPLMLTKVYLDRSFIRLETLPGIYVFMLTYSRGQNRRKSSLCRSVWSNL